MKQIKLVVWDLDDTFWNGTLLEGGISELPDNIEIVKRLTDRGIMNSIASKNDREAAEAKLKELNVWDYFIFPVMDWRPKGQMVGEIIEKAQLSPQGVLFVDDNPTNLAEVKFVNPEVHVESPEFLKQLLAHPAFAGKDDASHSRLQQYRLLETKDKERVSYGNNEQFLRQSGIRLELIRDLLPITERLHEMIERTNQLNFTQQRIELDDLRQLLNNDDFENLAFAVKDNYGDYGIAGFSSADKRTKKLSHFLFSCRVMHMGVEQFVYHHLGCLPFEQKCDNQESLIGSSKPDWINLVDSGANLNFAVPEDKRGTRVLLKGSCESQIIGSYLDNLAPHLNVAVENIARTNNNHTVVMRDSLNKDAKMLQSIVDELPFLRSDHYVTRMFDSDHDVLILNVSSDSRLTMYQRNGTDVRVPWGLFDNVIERDVEYMYQRFHNTFEGQLTRDFYVWFKNNFECKGKITIEEFTENLTFIRNTVKQPIIFVNLPSVVQKHPDDENPKQTQKRAIAINAVMDDFVKRYDNCWLLDVRKFVTQESDIGDDGVHYVRKAYFEMTKELISLIEEVASGRKAAGSSKPDAAQQTQKWTMRNAFVAPFKALGSLLGK